MATSFHMTAHTLSRCCRLATIATFFPVAAALSACGSPASAPTPTSTPRPATVSHSLSDQRAVTTAERFLRAFQRDKKAAMIGLMGPGLRVRNRRVLVAQMLGAQDQPSQIRVVRTRTFPGRHGGWTRVLVRLQFDHGAVFDRLIVVKRASKYHISRIMRGRGRRS